MRLVVFTAPWQVLELEREGSQGGSELLEDCDGGADDFGPNAVAGNRCDLVGWNRG